MQMSNPTVGYGAAEMGMGLTRRLAAFTAATRYEDLPPEAVSAVRRGILDWMGCALAGSSHPSVQILTGTLARLGSAPVAGVLGQNLKLGLTEAALANGQM